MKTRFKAPLAVLLCAAVLSPAGVSAAGYENIGGYAGPQATFYDSRRRVDNPATPGPEVAFYQTGGNPGLFLGAWGCPGGWAGGPMYKQSVGSWQPVAYSSEKMTFCIFTYSNSGPGDFWGDLAWD